jgi:hypothetical protein
LLHLGCIILGSRLCGRYEGALNGLEAYSYELLEVHQVLLLHMLLLRLQPVDDAGWELFRRGSGDQLLGHLEEVPLEDVCKGCLLLQYTLQLFFPHTYLLSK